jgi:hypothetical protein
MSVLYLEDSYCTHGTLWQRIRPVCWRFATCIRVVVLGWKRRGNGFDSFPRQTGTGSFSTEVGTGSLP